MEVGSGKPKVGGTILDFIRHGSSSSNLIVPRNEYDYEPFFDAMPESKTKKKNSQWQLCDFCKPYSEHPDKTPSSWKGTCSTMYNGPCEMTPQQMAIHEERENKEECTPRNSMVADEDLIDLKKYYHDYPHKHLMHHKLRSVFKRLGTKQRTISWFRVRKTKITASQFAACLACDRIKRSPIHSYAYRFKSRYRNAKKLLTSKLEVMEECAADSRCDTNATQNMILNWGVVHEDMALRRAMELCNLHVLHTKEGTGKNKTIVPIDFGLLEHPIHKFIAGSPDAITLDGAIVEVKCPWSIRKRKKIVTGYVPDEYYCQMQILMEITNLDKAYFVQYAPETVVHQEYLSVTIVRRSKAFFEKTVLPVASEFHQKFMNIIKQGPINQSKLVSPKQKKPRSSKREDYVHTFSTPIESAMRHCRMASTKRRRPAVWQSELDAENQKNLDKVQVEAVEQECAVRFSRKWELTSYRVTAYVDKERGEHNQYIDFGCF